MENALDSVLAAIRARSDLIVRYEPPRTLLPAEILIRELHGLLELLWLLNEAGVETRDSRPYRRIRPRRDRAAEELGLGVIIALIALGRHSPRTWPPSGK